MRFILGTALVMALAGNAHAANLVTNGNFESGNTGFTTEYNIGGGGPGGNTTEGQYQILTNPFPWNSSFVSIGDHTSGSGLMMVANGSPVAGQIVWRSLVLPISQLTNYFFEAFVANVCCQGGGVNPPILTFTVSLNGGAEQVLSTLTIPANPVGQWIGLSSTFNSGTATTARLTLVNANTIRQGNDFAIDDINLDTASIVNPVPEPGTWLMMVAGFGICGLALQRKQQAARIRLA
jgi:PEP-CTERM motif